MRLSTFIIALIMAGVVATTLTLSAVDLSGKYSVSYDEDSLEVFESTQKLHNLSQDLEEDVINQTDSQTGVVDLVGSFIGKAVSSMKMAATSFVVFEDMAEASTTKLKLPSYFLTAISSIMIIAIMFVIISALLKKDV